MDREARRRDAEDTLPYLVKIRRLAKCVSSRVHGRANFEWTGKSVPLAPSLRALYPREIFHTPNLLLTSSSTHRSATVAYTLSVDGGAFWIEFGVFVLPPEHVPVALSSKLKLAIAPSLDGCCLVPGCLAPHQRFRPFLPFPLFSPSTSLHSHLQSITTFSTTIAVSGLTFRPPRANPSRIRAKLPEVSHQVRPPSTLLTSLTRHATFSASTSTPTKSRSASPQWEDAWYRYGGLRLA